MSASLSLGCAATRARRRDRGRKDASRVCRRGITQPARRKVGETGKVPSWLGLASRQGETPLELAIGIVTRKGRDHRRSRKLGAKPDSPPRSGSPCLEFSFGCKIFKIGVDFTPDFFAEVEADEMAQEECTFCCQKRDTFLTA